MTRWPCLPRHGQAGLGHRQPRPSSSRGSATTRTAAPAAGGTLPFVLFLGVQTPWPGTRTSVTGSVMFGHVPADCLRSGYSSSDSSVTRFSQTRTADPAAGGTLPFVIHLVTNENCTGLAPNCGPTPEPSTPRALIVTFSQSAGPSLAIWANPVRFSVFRHP